MKISNYFIPVLKEDPADAVIISHKLMIRAGMIRQQNAGIYVWLPLGLRVLKKIENIIREGMDEAGAIEILMPCIQPQTLWKESGRADSYGEEMLRITDRHEAKLLFGPTNEEVVTDLFRNTIKSYKALPKNFYHIQWKFRDEIRPRFGVLRCREFYMKDAYSFDLDKESAKQSYDNMFKAYLQIFRKMGLNSIPATAATGPIGGDLSHEFHVITEVGESEIFYTPEIEVELEKQSPNIKKLQALYSVTDEVHDSGNCSPEFSEKLKRHKSIEIGQVFYSAAKYTEAMGVAVQGKDGQQITPHCGCYGIGVSRIVAAIIEVSHDEKGIVWPKTVAPFQVALINLHIKNETCCAVSEDLYANFDSAELEVLYDDSDVSPGNKLNSHDLIGIPWQVIVSTKLVEEGVVEVKNRKTYEVKKLPYKEAISFIKKEYDVR